VDLRKFDGADGYFEVYGMSMGFLVMSRLLYHNLIHFSAFLQP